MTVMDAPAQIGWASRRTATGDPRHRRHEPQTLHVWKPCPTCWGGRIIAVMDDDSPTGYVARVCGGCLGIGQVMA